MGRQRSIPPLARGTIDRDAVIRDDPHALDRAWRDPSARLLVLRNSDVPLVGNVLALRPIVGERTDEHWFLGRFAGAPVYAHSIEQHTADDLSEHDQYGALWTPALATGSILSPDESELVAMAVALQRWHASAAFSPRDGSPTVVAKAGWSRVEPLSGAEQFPRTDPAVIVLVVHEDRALLGSNKLWETGRFSLLAGFIEAGESAEQAARREVQEESGMQIGELEYLGSQPWPFPRSLMFSYRARLTPGQDPAALVPDPDEIAELSWFTRSELREPLGGLQLPRVGSIARWVIDNWVSEGDPARDLKAGGAANERSPGQGGASGV
jgi:NAD+ diphosphatase